MSFIATNPLLVAIIILAIITVALVVMVIAMHRKMKKFLIGIDSDHIGESLSYVSGGLDQLQAFRKELEVYLASVEKRLKKSVQAVHTVRFNPYKGEGQGGNQSFATAMLTEGGDGVVISSLHSRDHIRVFSKPVKARNSEFELSEEEREAIDGASEYLSA